MAVVVILLAILLMCCIAYAAAVQRTVRSLDLFRPEDVGEAAESLLHRPRSIPG